MFKKALGCAFAISTLTLAISYFGAGERNNLARAADDASTPTAKSAPLNGSIQTVQITLEDLRDAGLDLKNVAKAASGLYDEVSIRPVQLIEEPDAIINGVVISIPIGTVPVGPAAPAKKERVDASMQNLLTAVASLRATVVDFVGKDKGLPLTPAVQSELDPKVRDWINHVNGLDAHFGLLQKLTVSAPYNQDEIAQVATAMVDETKNIDKTRREIYKEIHKDGEHHKWF